jgi:hypothetical protein
MTMYHTLIPRLPVVDFGGHRQQSPHPARTTRTPRLDTTLQGRPGRNCNSPDLLSSARSGVDGTVRRPARWSSSRADHRLALAQAVEAGEYDAKWGKATNEVIVSGAGR